MILFFFKVSGKKNENIKVTKLEKNTGDNLCQSCLSKNWFAKGKVDTSILPKNKAVPRVNPLIEEGKISLL